MKTSQRAEIAVTLTILSLSILLLGSYLGTKSTVKDTVKRYFSKADTCDPFKSTLIIKNEDGASFGQSGQFEVASTNDELPKYDFRDTIPNTSSVRKAEQIETTYTFTPPQDQRNKYYQITLKKDDQIIEGEPFCRNNKDNGRHTGPCANQLSSGGVIKGIQVQCGGDIEYGWVLPKGTALGKGDVEVNTYLIDGSSAPRDTDSVCDPSKLKIANGRISGKQITPLQERMDLILSNDRTEKSLTKMKYTSRATFSSMPSGLYTLTSNELTKELTPVCAKNKTVSISSNETTQAALVYWVNPNRDCQMTTTCNQCKSLTSQNKIHECKATITSDQILCCPGETLKPSPTPTKKPSPTKRPTPTMSPTPRISPTKKPSPTITKTPTRSPTTKPSPTNKPQPPISCGRIRGSGNNQTRIMYIPIGFDDQKTFEGFVKLAAESLSKTNLPAEVINSIDHVYTTVDVARRAGCKKTHTTDVRGNGWTSHVCDDEALLLKACRHTNEVFIYPEEIATYARSYSYYAQLSYISTFDLIVSSTVAAHEFGHSIVSLLDEYLDPNLPGSESRYDQFVEKSANCAVTQEKCGLWNEECHAGCFYRNYYFRPSLNSIMNYHYTSIYWNRPSVSAWRTFTRRAGRSPSYSFSEDNSKPQNLMDIRIISNPPKILLEGYSKGYPSYAQPLVDDGRDAKPLTIRLLSHTATVWETDIPTQIYQTDVSAGYKKVRERSLSIPLLENASKIELLKNNVVVDEVIVDKSTRIDNEQFCGDGTYDSPSQDCKADIQIQKDYKNYEVLRLADVNNDTVINTLDLTAVQKQYGQVERTEGLSADINKDGVVNALDYEKTVQLLDSVIPTSSVLRK